MNHQSPGMLYGHFKNPGLILSSSKHGQATPCPRQVVHTMNKARLLIALAAMAVGAQQVEIEFEGRTAYNFVSPLPYVAPAMSRGFQFSTNFAAISEFSDAFAIVFDHRLRGVNNQALLPEQLYPFDNYLYAALRFEGPGTLQLGASNNYFPHAQSRPAPYYLGGIQVQPEMLNAVDGSWALEVERFHAAASGTYFIYNYRAKPADPFTDPFTLDSTPYGSQHDADLWSDLSMGVTLGDDFSLDAGMVMKNDLNRITDYDYYRFFASVSGEHALNRNRFMLEWRIAERHITSQAMKLIGDAEGFATQVDLRILWRIKSDFFIKGSGYVQLASRLAKQYYEAQIRKTWKSGSSIDIGYFAVNGGVFPRHGGRITARLRMAPHFGMTPGCEGYFMKLPGETALRHYRTDAGIEMFFPGKKRFEIFTGGNYRIYNRHPLFASRGAVFAGLRTW
jgi:hypothetical protein